MFAIQMGSSAVLSQMQGPPESLCGIRRKVSWLETSRNFNQAMRLTRTDELTEMMYNMAAPITLPALISVVNLLPFLSRGCPHPSNLNHLPTTDRATRSFKRSAENRTMVAFK